MNHYTHSRADRDRADVYACEDRLAQWFDLGEAFRDVVVFGSTWTLPTERTFSSIDAVQRYVTKVSARARGGLAPRVRRRRGARAAHYAMGVIAVPDARSAGSGGRAWAMREVIVLHELAHHFAAQGDHFRPSPGADHLVRVGDSGRGTRDIPDVGRGDAEAHGDYFRACLLVAYRAAGHDVAARLLEALFTEGVEAAGTDGVTASTRLRQPESPADTFDKPRTLIADLLARAERTDSEPERDLCLERAQREAARHGISMAEAAYAAAQRGTAPAPTERTVRIGSPGTPGLSTYTRLCLGVAEANGLRCLIGSRGARVHLMGMPDDIDTAVMLYESLAIQMARAATAWLASPEFARSSAAARRQWEAGLAAARPNKGVARRSFNRGFTDHICTLLREAAEQARSDALAQASEEASTVPGHRGVSVTTTALALRAKDEAVEEYYHQSLDVYAVRGAWRDRSQGSLDVQSVIAGRDAAEQADRGRRGTRGLPR